MHLIGYDWMPFAVEMATVDHAEPQRFSTDPGSYVWEQGASVISESLAEGYEPLINAERSLHVLEIIEAARRSQAEGKRIQLESKFPYPVIKSLWANYATRGIMRIIMHIGRGIKSFLFQFENIMFTFSHAGKTRRDLRCLYPPGLPDRFDSKPDARYSLAMLIPRDCPFPAPRRGSSTNT